MVRFGDTAETHTHTHCINVLTNWLLQFADEQGQGLATLLSHRVRDEKAKRGDISVKFNAEDCSAEAI